MKATKVLAAALALAVPVLAAPVAHATQGTAIEYFNAAMGHYFVTAFPEEAAAIDAGNIAGWQRTGNTFPVEMSQVAGSQPVCRFFTTAFAPKSSHFYTPDSGECATLKSNPTWQYEAIAFYLALPDASGQCATAATPIYRFYNNGETGAPNHRYTVDPLVVRLMKAQGWTAEGHGVTGVFACGPGAPPSKTTLAIKIEFNPSLRFLSTADGSAITSRTATTITFAKVVAIAAGDVFVVPEIGAWRAVSVLRPPNQTIVTVEQSTLEELFTELDISGTLDIDDMPEIGANTAAAGAATVGTKALQTETEVTFVKTTNAAGDKGRKFVAKLQAQCSSNPQNKMRLLEFTGELYGTQNIKFNMTSPASSILGPLTYMVAGGAYVGCKVSLPLGSPLKLLDVPFPYTAGIVRIQVIAQARLETNILPVLQIVEVQVEGNIPTTATAPLLKSTNPSFATTLLQGAAIGDTFNATLVGELDMSTKVILPVVSKLLASAGVKSGPALDVTATAVAKATGSDVDLCVQLKWPTELYAQYPSGRTLTTKTIFQTDYPVTLPDNWKQCLAGNAPTGDWRFTTTVCTPNPANPATCNIFCNDTFNFTLSANADKSKIDTFSPVGSSSLYISLTPQGPVRNYLGSTDAGGTIQVLTMQFSEDWKKTSWFYTAYVPSTGGLCGWDQTGNAVLTAPR